MKELGIKKKGVARFGGKGEKKDFFTGGVKFRNNGGMKTSAEGKKGSAVSEKKVVLTKQKFSMKLCSTENLKMEITTFKIVKMILSRKREKRKGKTAKKDSSYVNILWSW